MPNSTSRRAKIRKIKVATLFGMLIRTGSRRRGQHPKQHGCVRAKFEVLADIPAEYKVGLFAKPATYDALVRFSNGPQPKDSDRGAQGMAIKLIGVPGTKILSDQNDAPTHDFILVDGPVFFVRDIDWYARLVGELVRLPEGRHPEKWLADLKRAHKDDIAVVDEYHNRVPDSPLGLQFWSQVPYAFGDGDDTICRYSAVPHSENTLPPVPVENREENHLRRAMVTHLVVAGRPAVFDFCVQVHKNVTPAIIDNPTVQWDPREHPIQRVAVLTIPAQDFDRPEQDRLGEHLSYTPWHALHEHRPVGQINEVRRAVYAASSRLRHLARFSAAHEPTSPYPPKPPGFLERWAKRAAIGAVGLVGALVIAGFAFWPQFHVALPNYPPAEKQQVWLNQNWSPGAREWYHHASQGGQFPPMINVPYEWFIALEQPTLSIGASDLLADQRYLDRFGFIPSTSESGAFDWRRCKEPEGTTSYDSGGAGSPTWRHRLPVGFACSDPVTDPMLQPDGRPWRNPATGRTMSAIGLTCAACHTGRFTYNKTEVLVDGGSAMTDIVKLNTAIGLSIVFTKFDHFRFNRFALRLLGSDSNEASRALLAEQLDEVAKRVGQLHDLDAKAMASGKNVVEGFGRLDALNRIGNQVFSIDLGKPGNYAPSSAPVHYPRIWNVHWFDWAQYNGSIGQPMVRNAGEALGTGSPIVLQAAPSSAAELTAPLFTSTVQFQTLAAMENLLAGKQPDETAGFNGLASPKWPADILGLIDTKLAERGARIYDDKCAHCHLPAVGSPDFWKSDRWLKANDFGQRYLSVNLIPISEIGTDPAQADGMANRKVDLPSELGITGDIYADALGQLVEKAANRWYESQTPPVPDDKRQQMNGFRKNALQKKLVYKARPLNGVWASPPYLHNGSVPNIEALLSPVAERPTTFWLGHREYDPKRLGYRTDELSGGSLFDTTQPGNLNTGHEFDDGPMRPGRIGRKLSPDERNALIEYLKTL